MKYTILITVILVSFIIGLSSLGYDSTASDRRRGRKIESVNKHRVEETYLDTLNRGQELSLIDSDIPPDMEEGRETDAEKVKKTVDGFRIQLMASTSVEKLRMKKKAIEKELKLKIYIEHDEPYYKVYAGDFTQRNRADKALVKVKESGYPDAWIVKTKVFVEE
jgi:hypothetical protein